MARQTFGVIDDERVYSVEEIAAIFHISVAKAKAFIRAEVKYAEPWEGGIQVSGRLYRIAVERMSELDTPEKQTARKRRAGKAPKEAAEA